MILDTIKRALESEVRTKNRKQATTLRMLLASIHNEKISKKHDLSDDEIILVLKREKKKCEEAREIYKNAGRVLQAHSEEQELMCIAQFLPAQMSDEELNKVISKVVHEKKDIANFGVLMKEIMTEVAGRADGSVVAKHLKKFLK